MYPLGHFAIGVSIGFLILILKPKILKNYIKNDIFFVLALGIFSILPDLFKLIYGEHPESMNLFFFHTYFDSISITLEQKTTNAIIMIGIAIILGYVYKNKLYK